VRIKAQTEIEQTLGKNGKNRGLYFDPEEMAPYCGCVVKVRKSVTKIIDEPTGKMLHMKQSCIMLEGVVCKAEYASCRLHCPQAIPAYWREIWIERVNDLYRNMPIILPWTLKDEIMQQWQFILEWGGHFVVPIQTVAIY
jgi:hypothetical protein